MKSCSGLTLIITGVSFLILNIVVYMNNPSVSYYVPPLFFFLIYIIAGVFDLKSCYNKNLLLVVVTVLLVMMWIVSFIQPLSPEINKMGYFIEIGLLTLGIIVMIEINLLKKWEQFYKSLERYDKVISVNPNDVIALNNKGVELASQRGYMEAIKCFDNVLEIDPEDATALHNKNVIEQKLKHRTLSDYLTDYPKLEINEKNEKQSIEIKKE